MLTSPSIKTHFWGVEGLVYYDVIEPHANFWGAGR
jgi:hypothetical protein